MSGGVPFTGEGTLVREATGWEQKKLTFVRRREKLSARHSRQDQGSTLRGQFSWQLEPFYGRNGRRAIAHTLLVEQAGASVCRVVFQQCELRTQLTPPVLGRLKQASTDSLTSVPAADRDLSDEAIGHNGIST